jgi:hypothetical protein
MRRTLVARRVEASCDSAFLLVGEGLGVIFLFLGFIGYGCISWIGSADVHSVS